VSRRRAAALLVAVAVAGLALADGLARLTPEARVTRAADAMERLAGLRFTLVASSVASGDAAAGGDLALDYAAEGELVPPDRLRLRVTRPRSATLVIIGSRAWIDGRPAEPAALRTLAAPTAVLAQLREPGSVRALGLGLAGLAVVARYRIDRDDRGTVEVSLDLLGDLVRRQSFNVGLAGPADGSGLAGVRTAFQVDYRDLGATLDIREPAGP
jgi:hypothetical protein